MKTGRWTQILRLADNHRIMRLALIDDDEMARSLLARALRKAGHAIAFESPDGSHALTQLAAADVDAIITDCQMPHMDGLALTRALRSRGDTRPIIMLSGLAEEMIIRVALSIGVTRYLIKPFNETILLAALNDVTASREVAA